MSEVRCKQKLVHVVFINSLIACTVSVKKCFIYDSNVYLVSKNYFEK